jgi:hypothetical protein
MKARLAQIVPSRISRLSDYLIALLVTVVGHVILFFCLVALAVWEMIAAPAQVVGQMPPPEVMVEIRPEMFARVSDPPPPAEDPSTRMVRTAAYQESTSAPDETNLIGERNTIAMSELPPDPDGPAVPSQDGEKPRRPGSLDTFDSSFNDGMEPDVVATPALEEQPPPGDPALKPNDSEADPADVPDPALAAPPPGGDPREELRVTDTQVPVPSREEDAEREEEAESLPKESTSASEAAEAKPSGGAPETTPAKPKKPRDPGFRSEVKKKRMRGSISRKGRSSLDVENTAMGRYQAQLGRAVEREWQRNCLRYREHITPGMLTIRFLLDEKGRVSSIRFLEVMEANTIQKGFTMKSIQSADYPTMPKEIARDLDGDPLELVYNFFF